MTDQPTSLAAALLALQADLPRIPRTATGQAGNRVYQYPPYDKILARVRPVLAAHGFLWGTKPTMTWITEVPRFVLRYTLTHVPTGETITGDFPLAEGHAQQQGSQISYAKRYALVAVLDLEVVGEDDDGMPERRELDVPPARMRDRMTPTKTTGTDHEQLRGGAVEPTPDDRPADRQKPVDNPPVGMWTDQAPGDFDIGQPEARPGSIDPRGAQMRNLQRAFQAAGITDRTVRLGMVSDMIGREILTANQLSQVEACHVIEALKERMSQP